MSQETAVQVTNSRQTLRGRKPVGTIGIFDRQFIDQLLIALAPQIKAFIKEAMADEGGEPLIVDYEEAGRMIGTTYEGIRKLVRKGRLKAVSRSGRHRGIAVAELKEYVLRSQLNDENEK